MYGRVVVYTHQDDKVELEAKARAGVIPNVTSTPGYISYGVMFGRQQSGVDQPVERRGARQGGRTSDHAADSVRVSPEGGPQSVREAVPHQCRCRAVDRAGA